MIIRRRTARVQPRYPPPSRAVGRWGLLGGALAVAEAHRPPAHARAREGLPTPSTRRSEMGPAAGLQLSWSASATAPVGVHDVSFETPPVAVADERDHIAEHHESGMMFSFQVDDAAWASTGPRPTSRPGSSSCSDS